MTDHAAQLIRLRGLCPGAELWTEPGKAGGPLVYLPGLKVESSGSIRTIDGLLCPYPRDGYDTRMFYSEQMPVARNWAPHVVMGRGWAAHSWSGISFNQPWLDILASHLETVK